MGAQRSRDRSPPSKRTKIVGTFLLTNVTPGTYNFTVTNPGGPNASKPFSVQTPISIPTITTFTPGSGVNTAPLSVTITGTEFRKGATVTITNRSTTATVAGTLINTTTIKVSLPLKGIPAGLYNLTVTNTDGSSATQENNLTVVSGTPSVTKVNPVSGYNTGTAQVTVTGTNFGTGASIVLVKGGTSITGTVVSLSPNHDLRYLPSFESSCRTL